MKLQVTQENLNKALGTVARVANTRGTLPVLSNVLLRTAGGRLSVTATNLDIAITHHIGSKISEEGAITVPARLMQEFIGSLPPGVINLSLDDYRLHVEAEQYQSVINGVSADEFPVMPAITSGTAWKVPASELRKGLSQVIMAASADEARPILTGVLLHTVDNKLYIVATDSYRLAEKQLSSMRQAVHLLVPSSAMQDLLRIVGDFDEEVRVTHDEQQILFQVGDVELVARLIEGAYPDYRQLIPKEFETTAQLSKADLLNVTKVSSLFARESAGSITIHIDGDAQQLSIRSVASQLGENTATAPAKVSGGGDITINSRYLLDALHAIAGTEVVFGFNDKLAPSVIKDVTEPGYVHVIMPLKS
ncbi:MAG TPA: DNA polymerase III subunit beta [Candidatus Saccharimonadales bacterium]|nr:DNA polymerase III subunit beta [Candidatus Saccharimonadales bacterium]